MNNEKKRSDSESIKKAIIISSIRIDAVLFESTPSTRKILPNFVVLVVKIPVPFFTAIVDVCDDQLANKSKGTLPLLGVPMPISQGFAFPPFILTEPIRPKLKLPAVTFALPLIR